MYPHERSLVQSMAGRPFKLLGVNNDQKKKIATDAIASNDLNWRSWFDGPSGPIVKKFKITGFPTIFLIDHRGVVRSTEIRGNKLDEAIEYLVAEAEAEIAKGEERYPIRQFVDTTGKFKVKARLVRLEGDQVVLQKESGDEVKLPITKLSKTDQSYVSSEKPKE